MPVSTKNKNAPAAERQELLRFGRGNAKLAPWVWHFSILAGHTCPGACKCLAKVKEVVVDGVPTRRLVDGPHALKEDGFRCFSATEEVAFASLYKRNKHNLTLLRARKDEHSIRDLLERSLPTHAKHVRIHVSGDFYNQAYFNAWMRMAVARPTTQFYAYTKSIPFWRVWLKEHKKLPVNMTLTASRGGKFDDLILPSMKTVMVVDHPDTAKALGLEIDHDDSLAATGDQSFALLKHGMQAKGSASALQLKRMKTEGVKFAYS